MLRYHPDRTAALLIAAIGGGKQKAHQLGSVSVCVVNRFVQFNHPFAAHPEEKALRRARPRKKRSNLDDPLLSLCNELVGKL
jgi:hypothetical protein